GGIAFTGEYHLSVCSLEYELKFAILTGAYNKFAHGRLELSFHEYTKKTGQLHGDSEFRQIGPKLLRADETDGIETKLLTGKDILFVIVDKDRAGRLDGIPVEENPEEPVIRFAHLLDTGNDYAVEPIQEVEFLLRNREAFGRPVRQRIDIVIGVSNCTKNLYRSMDRTRDGFLPPVVPCPYGHFPLRMPRDQFLCRFGK